MDWHRPKRNRDSGWMLFFTLVSIAMLAVIVLFASLH
jgi:hypothetical protein